MERVGVKLKKYVSVICVIGTILALAACGKSHTHEWEDATCTEPQKCSKCDETKGEPKGHQFEYVSCTKPKTCSICGETKGKAVGHSVELGKCSKCNEMQGYDIVLEICNVINKGNDKVTDGTNIISYGAATTFEGLYKDACSGVKKFQSAEGDFKKAMDMCKDYPELSDLKNTLKKAANSTPNKPKSATKDALTTWGNSYSKYLTDVADMNREAGNVAKKFAK